MGVNLSSVVEATEIEMSDLCGKKVAVDAYNAIYQFLSTIRQRDGYPLADSQGRVTSHLSGILYRTANLIEAGIEPVYVFDGKPHVMKADTLRERRDRREKAEEEWMEAVEAGDMERAFTKAQQSSRMTDEVRDTSIELLGLMGVPIVMAPSDGEAQSAHMCAVGEVHAAASQDYDSILFGSPRLVRNLTSSGRRKIPGRNAYRDVRTEIIESGELFGTLGVTREQLVDVAILMGTDFNPGIKGIGPKRGLDLIRKHGDIESALAHVGGEIPGYQEVRDIFLRGEYVEGSDLSVGGLDFDGVVGMLTERDFSAARVEAALKRIEEARKTNRSKSCQRSLSDWF
ncbi:MAG: flap endonuclease-1 [Thermoplasmatales archaeon]|nr:flap endonuclease-1 [Thermoplasmatales archaeon]